MSGLSARIDVISTSRADLSLLAPVARALAERDNVDARLVVTGARSGGGEVTPCLFSAHPRLRIAEVRAPDIGGSTLGSARALATMTDGFANLWNEGAPDLVVLLGDRFELFAPLAVAVLFGLPIAHLYGGEEDVAYCFDTQVRNAVTKAAHLHLVAHEAQRLRLLAMGEERWRVHVCGNTAITGVETHLERQRQAFEAWAKAAGLGDGPLIAACHLPTTIVPGLWRGELDALFRALDQIDGLSVVWSGVNADPESTDIRTTIRARTATRPNEVFVEGLGTDRYFGLLRRAVAMIGNSSSGLLEAASFGLPVVNVGARQTGRLAGANVHNVPADANRIEAALRAILERPERAVGRNPFDRSDASERVADLLVRAAGAHKVALMLKRTPDAEKLTAGLSRVPEYPPFANLSAAAVFQDT